MNNALANFLLILGSIITLAIIAVVVSKNSNSSGVITAFFNGFSSSIKAAVSPVTGGSVNTGSLSSSGASLASGLFNV